MSDVLTQGSITGAEVYEGGSLSKISVEDLENNRIAITQLINNFNEKAKKLETVEKELADTKGELEYQNTYPFITIFAAIFNVAGTIMVGMSVNQLSSAAEGENRTTNIILLCLGGFIVILSSLSTILYKWGRRWFNKKANIG
jgi:hypothetical protein